MPGEPSREVRSFEGIPYTLIRSGRRKTAAILVEPSGEVVVRVPDTLDDQEVEALLDSRRARILRAVGEVEDREEEPDRDLEPGATVPFLGSDYALVFHDQQDRVLHFDGEAFHLRRQTGVEAASRYQAALRRFYIDAGKTELPPRVERWSERLGVEPTAVRVLDLRSRWASCSPKRALNFHWRALMAPVEVLDYLVVHELAHLRVPDHSRAFWRIVEDVMPDHDERHGWLRRHGAELTL